MSLQIAAQHLAKKGRGPDTELVHMTKGEIAGLQSLALAHGGSLTINPHTGLAEAGFLSSILPTLAGAAAMYFTGGAAAPFLAAGAGALTSYALNPKGGLGSLAMGALGGYGGGSLAGGFMGAGAQAAGAEAGAQALGVNVADMGTAVGNNAMGLSAPITMPAAPIPGTDSVFSGGYPEPTRFLRGDVVNPQPIVTAPTAFDPAQISKYTDAYTKATAPSLSNMGRGVTEAFNNPMDFLKNNYKGLGAIAAPIAAGMTPNYTGAPASTQSSGNITPFGFTRNVDDSDPRNPRVNQYYTAGTPVNAPGPAGYPYQPGQVIGMADGGMAMGNENYPLANSQQVNYASFSQNPVQNNVLNNASDVKVDPSTGAEMFAQGGIASLGSYSDGGQLLKGPGNGTSDSIPAVIGSNQPARLADNEFVIPARIVSELGNGSSDAGARELYKMMDRVQKARGRTVGKGKVAVDAKARNHLPA